MGKQRRLEDLFVRGEFVTFDDGLGPVTVWLQKLSPVEMASALRRANAARARIRTIRTDPDSDEYMDLWLEVLEWETTEDLVMYLAAEAEMRLQERYEAEVAAEEEWDEEGYLQGLRDAWEGGGKDAYLVARDSPEGAEGARVLGELDRFAKQAEEKAGPDIAAARAELEALPVAELQEMAMTRVIRHRASSAWLDELHRCELFYGVHEAVPNQAAGDEQPWVAMPGRYWPRREDFDRVQAAVLRPLFEKYQELLVDVMEGKDSEEIPTSSPSSGEPPELATGISSGPVAVPQ